MKLTKSEAMKIGKVMQRVREMQKYTVEQMAEMTDCTTSQILRYEQGKFGLDSARYVKVIFDIGSRYNCRVLPNYFKEYYESSEVQDALVYFESIGYALRKMRRTLRISIDSMANRLGIPDLTISYVEKNVYVDPEQRKRYIFYLYKLYAMSEHIVPPVVLSYVLGYQIGLNANMSFSTC